MEITIDEWIVHYISDPEKFETTVEFLEKVFNKCDRFVTIKGEGLDRKIWQMDKKSSRWDPKGRKFVKWFMANFRHNSEKFLVLDESGLKPLHPDLEKATPPDELYLVKAATTTESSILTTDNRFKERLSHRKELTFHIVDEFLNHYNC